MLGSVSDLHLDIKIALCSQRLFVNPMTVTSRMILNMHFIYHVLHLCCTPHAHGHHINTYSLTVHNHTRVYVFTRQGSAQVVGVFPTSKSAKIKGRFVLQPASNQYLIQIQLPPVTRPFPSANVSLWS